ncbi:hypothetical protein ACF0H5_003166 [Mactra antiquata]
MRALSLISLVLLLVVVHARYGQHRPIRQRYLVPPGLTSDGRQCPVTNGCVRVPTLNDVITIGQFQSEMSGRRYYVIYRIDHVPLGVLNRQESVFTLEGNTVYGALKARTQDGMCVNIPRSEIGTLSSNTHAVLIKDDFSFFGVPGTHSPIFYFISDNPSQYQILFVCIDRFSIRNGVCEGQYFLDIGVTQDPPNSPPYYEIELVLRRTFGLSLSDHLNVYQYIGMACP